ncbi:MAG: ExeM/NucH family extracellular endonuclease [Actinomycetes bacterium]
MKRLLCVVLLLLVLAVPPAGAAPVSALYAPMAAISLTGGAYSENFDTLAYTPDAGTGSVLPTGWAFSESGTAANTTYGIGTGSLNTGNTYSFGATSSTERALGGLQSGSLIPTIGAEFQNNAGAAIVSLAVSYNCEQWRIGNASTARDDRLDLQYSTDATSLTTGTWTDVNTLDCINKIKTAAAAGALDGNLAANRTSVSDSITGLSITNGTTFWIRWNDLNASGADDGLSVDDFSLTPTTSVVDNPPTVSSTTPATDATNVAANSDVTVTFSENVTATGEWFGMVCPTSGTRAVADTVVTGGPLTFTINPNVDFASGETCTVTVFAAQVKDQDGTADPMAANYAWSFTTQSTAACGSAADLIHTIQGSGSTSPVVGQTRTIEGIVVADYQNTAGGEMGGFFVQEEAADFDADPATSEGIYVYDSANAVAVGDKVRVTGTVVEYIASGGTPAYTLPLTELSPVSSVLVCSSGNSFTSAGLSLPVAAVSDLEAFEGMRVTITQTLTVADNYTLGRYGEILLAQGGPIYQFTHLNAPNALNNATYLATVAKRSILLDDASTTSNRDPITYPAPGLSAANTLRAGDTLHGVSGVLDQRYDVYRIQPVGAIAWTHSNPRPATSPAVGGTLRVAGVNMLNYFTTLTTSGAVCGPAGDQACRGANTPQEFTRQQDKLVQEIKGLNDDVIGLMEIENASTDVPQQTLVNALNAAIGGTPYSFIATGPVGTDAIRVGLIYRTANVTPIGAFQINTDATFSRPPLAQTFQDNTTGEKFSVVVNHFKSKGCAGASGTDLDQGDGQGCWNTKRVAQATLLLTFINATVIPNSGDDPDVLIVGDLNAYAREAPITTLKTGGYTDLVNEYLGTAGYSYSFDGQLGYLDHALASASLTAQVSGAAEWHINADEPIALDYNTEFKSAGQVSSLYAADQYRASDHDPVVVGLNLTITNDLSDPPANYGTAWHTYSGLMVGDTWAAGHSTQGSASNNGVARTLGVAGSVDTNDGVVRTPGVAWRTGIGGGSNGTSVPVAISVSMSWTLPS